MNESIKALEEKIAYLERHVVEQDKAMLALADELAAIRRKMQSLRDTSPERASQPGGTGDAGEVDDRPPHY